MSCRDLDLWPLDHELLQHSGCHAFKLRTKLQWNRIIHGWVIDDLARFRVQFLGGGSELSFLRNAWIQFHQSWPEHRAIISALHFCFRIQISCCSKRGRLTFEWSFKRRQISHFFIPPRDPFTNCWSFTYDRTSEIHFMAIHCAAAEHGGLI